MTSHTMDDTRPLVITIDGPSGAGKTTVSRRLADRLGCRYVDTGALYRAVAWKVDAAGADYRDAQALKRLLAELKPAVSWREGLMRIHIDGRDVTDGLRSPKISMLASRLSALSLVRAYLLDLQRALGRRGKVVFEGRDMGTVVFPRATLKIFLDASPDARARRRYRELAAAGNQSLEEVRRDMQQRDRNDSTRDLAPLKKAPDMLYIDSTGLSVDEVVDRILAGLPRRGDLARRGNGPA